MQLNAQALLFLVSWAGGLVFGAGGAWFMLRQLRKDVNGLGSKLRRRDSLLIRWADTEQKREELARTMEGN